MVLILYFLVSHQLVVAQVRQVLVVLAVVDDTTSLLVEQHPHLDKDLLVVLVALVLVALLQATAIREEAAVVLVLSVGMALAQNLETVV